VTGIDMTDEQLDVARSHVEEYTATLGFKKPNMTFVKGYIECLGDAGIKDESVDIIMSNCVVNLSPDKQSVLAEAYRCDRTDAFLSPST
jgi:arsenite methyltransferase